LLKPAAALSYRATVTVVLTALKKWTLPFLQARGRHFIAPSSLNINRQQRKKAIVSLLSTKI
jgi:hypothetical protein